MGIGEGMGSRTGKGRKKDIRVKSVWGSRISMLAMMVMLSVSEVDVVKVSLVRVMQKQNSNSSREAKAQ